MVETISLLAIIFCAGFLQGLTGFGFALIALPLLGLFLPLKVMVPLVCMLALCVNAYLCVQLRKSIKPGPLFTVLLASLPGIPMGAYLLKTVPAQPLSLLLGCLMVLFTGYQLIANPTPRPLATPWALVAGLTSGLLGGSIGASGPPVILYSTLQPWPKDQVKGNLVLYFALSGVFIVASQALGGLVTPEVITFFWRGFPALACGIFAGTIAYRHFTDRGYRHFAMVVVLLLGIMMIVRNI